MRLQIKSSRSVIFIFLILGLFFSELSAASKITSVVVKEEAGHTLITLTKNDRYRIVVDIKDTTLAFDTRKIPLGNSMIERIRSGENKQRQIPNKPSAGVQKVSSKTQRAISASSHGDVADTKSRIALMKFSSLLHNHVSVQIGNYWSNQGSPQQVNINTLIGDYFNVTSGRGSNYLVGLGYFIDAQERDRFKMSYGIDGFYLPQTSVSGTVLQENLFTNLSYKYNITHYPLYFVAKSSINTKSPEYNVMLDIGVGPDIITTSHFQENSLDGGMTIPDQIFSGKTTTAFSATTGIGIKFNHFLGLTPLECGYRFFYLGKGTLKPLSDQVLNKLSGGSNYANAVICSITL